MVVYYYWFGKITAKGKVFMKKVKSTKFHLLQKLIKNTLVVGRLNVIEQK